MNKATLGGYRHLLRKARPDTGTIHDGHAALTELQGILAVELAQASSSNQFEPLLGRVIVLVTAIGDGLKLDPASESLWTTRFDIDAGSSANVSEAWRLVGEKLSNEPATTSLSLVRILHAVAHLATTPGTSFRSVATRALWAA